MAPCRPSTNSWVQHEIVGEVVEVLHEHVNLLDNLMDQCLLAVQNLVCHEKEWLMQEFVSEHDLSVQAGDIPRGG